MIVAEMLNGLAGKPVEVWTHAKTDGPTFDGVLATIGTVARGDEDVPDGAALVGWIELRDDRGLDIRVPAYSISAVCARGR